MFAPLLKEAYSYSYDEEPNYNKLVFMMKSMLIDLGYDLDNHFTWSFMSGENTHKLDAQLDGFEISAKDLMDE